MIRQLFPQTISHAHQNKTINLSPLQVARTLPLYLHTSLSLLFTDSISRDLALLQFVPNWYPILLGNQSLFLQISNKSG